MPPWLTIASKPIEWLLKKGWPGFCVLLSLCLSGYLGWSNNKLYEDNKTLFAESSRLLVECYQRPRWRPRTREPANDPGPAEKTEAP